MATFATGFPCLKSGKVATLMPQLHLRFNAEQPQFRFKFPRPALPRPAKNPFLAALECDFRRPDDGRKWKARCWLKRQLCRGYSKLGRDATERQLSRFLGIPPRTVRWGIRILKEQGFLSNVRRQGYNGPMLRQLHPGQLQLVPFTVYNLSDAVLGFRPSFASNRESCRPTRRESCRVTSPKNPAGVPVGLGLNPARSIPQELRRAQNRRSSPPSFQGKPTPRKPYVTVAMLIPKAMELTRAGFQGSDLAEELKCFAARSGLDYSYTPAGGNHPIVQAMMIATLRANPSAPIFQSFRGRR